MAVDARHVSVTLPTSSVQTTLRPFAGAPPYDHERSVTSANEVPANVTVMPVLKVATEPSEAQATWNEAEPLMASFVASVTLELLHVAATLRLMPPVIASVPVALWAIGVAPALAR